MPSTLIFDLIAIDLIKESFMWWPSFSVSSFLLLLFYFSKAFLFFDLVLDSISSISSSWISFLLVKLKISMSANSTS